MGGKAMSGEAKHDVDLIPMATGLLTIELAFLTVFVYGSLAPTDFANVKTGFLSFNGLAGWLTIFILSALVGAILSAASTLVAVSQRWSSSDRLIRMSAGLLGLAGLGFVVHLFVAMLTENEWTDTFLLGVAVFVVVISFLLAGSWRFARPTRVEITKEQEEDPGGLDVPPSGT
jgi:hypothetical protein